MVYFWPTFEIHFTFYYYNVKYLTLTDIGDHNFDDWLKGFDLKVRKKSFKYNLLFFLIFIQKYLFKFGIFDKHGKYFLHVINKELGNKVLREKRQNYIFQNTRCVYSWMVAGKSKLIFSCTLLHNAAIFPYLVFNLYIYFSVFCVRMKSFVKFPVQNMNACCWLI